LPGATAAYNRGNALARLGRFDDAIAAYDEALSQQPGMADAQANRAAVEAARNRKPPPGQAQDPRAPQKPRDDGDSQPKSGEAGDPSDSQPGDAQGQGDQRPPPADPEPQASDTPPPADAQAQRDADAQQREQMQRALDGQTDPTDEDTTDAGATGAETGDEREQANAAWLRRVPDDPGGLLRAKFRLEHERRATGGDR
jgi:Ca-activated chloride channel homolog